MKLFKTFLLFLIFYPATLWSQDFSVPFNKSGLHNYHRVKMLSDSSLISIIPVNLLSKKTNQYDSFVQLIVRQNKRGEVLYYSSLTQNDLSNNYIFLDMDVIKDEIFICGYQYYGKGDTGDILGVIIRFNKCLEVEKFVLFKNRNWTSNYFSSIKFIGDSSLLVQCSSMIQSDSLYATALLIDTKLRIINNASFIGDDADIEITNKNIHLWGDAYYPRPSNPNVSDRKLNHVILDFKGNIIYQNIENKDNEGKYGAGSRIISSRNSDFLIACIGLKPPAIYFNGLRKMDIYGKLLQTVILNESKDEEVATAICQVNNDRFIIISITAIDFDYRNCTLYLIDSNLNVIRKKRILSNYNYVDFLNCIGYDDGALLYGQFIEKLDDNPRAILYKVDTFFNVVRLPNVIGYNDSLCLNPISGQEMLFPDPDTVWVESLNLRKNLYVQTGINNFFIGNLDIFPNPNSGQFTASFNTPLSGNYYIYDNTGKIVLENEFKDLEELKFNLDYHKNGLYYLIIQTDTQVFTKTIIINY